MTPRALAAAAFAALAALATLAAPVRAQDAERPTNLQVLPKTLTRGEVMARMREMSSALGVQCRHCHAPREGGAQGALDHASDANPKKETARAMMRMVNRLNGELLPAMPGRGTPPVEVTCMTCHRTAARPLMLEDTLQRVLVAQGADSTLAIYERLRQRYHGRFTYDFGERSLNALAERLVAEGKLADARWAMQLNARQFPESPNVAAQLGRIHESLGDTANALVEYRRALQLQPNNQQTQERLRRLEAARAGRPPAR